MHMFLLLATLTATALATLELHLSDTESKPAGRIVGGVNVASESSWKWQASLQYYSNGYYHHFCGGTLIRKRWVMTAAHCVNSFSSIRVALGDLVLNSTHHREQYRNVIRVYIHPDWNNDSISSGNDIALLQLSSDVTTNSYVGPATLPSAGEILPANINCYLTGYGRTSTDGNMSSHMKQATLPIVDHETCTSSGWWGSTVKTNMICAGGGAQSGCNGDFGGPLNCYIKSRWAVYGIASFVSGMGCNASQKPTVFTRVSAYTTWLNSVMNSP